MCGPSSGDETAGKTDDVLQDGTQAGRSFFGRRKGHRLSPHQSHLMETLLPRIRLDLSAPAPQAHQAAAGLFGGSAREVWLEIGFGGGEHLLWQARSNPHAGIIGCEPYVNGVAKLLAGIAAQELGNVRIHDDDARAVLDWLAPGTLTRIFILFPDPWPKKRQRKRRFINPSTVAALAHALAPGGELHFATDIADYAEQARDMVTASPAFAALAPQMRDWPITRYEQKALAAGRACTHLRFARLAGGG